VVRIEVTYQGDLRCEVVHAPSGNRLLTDAPVDNQGRGEHFSPTDLVAAAFGSCLATVMGIVAEREAIDLLGMKITVTKEMVADPRRRIGRLATRVEIPHPLTSGMKARLEQAARSCPVMESLCPEVEAPIEFVYR
jgi:putative redox protein